MSPRQVGGFRQCEPVHCSVRLAASIAPDTEALRKAQCATGPYVGSIGRVSPLRFPVFWAWEEMDSKLFVLLGELGSFFLSRSFLLPVRYFAERTPQLLGSEPVIVIWPSARPCMFQSEAASRFHPTSRGPFSWCRTYFFGPAGRGVGGRHLKKATCKVKRQGWIFQYDDVCGILNKLDGWMGAVGLTPVWGIDRLLRPEGAGRMGHWATVREESVRATRPTQLQLVVRTCPISMGQGPLSA